VTLYDRTRLHMDHGSPRVTWGRMFRGRRVSEGETAGPGPGGEGEGGAEEAVQRTMRVGRLGWGPFGLTGKCNPAITPGAMQLDLEFKPLEIKGAMGGSIETESFHAAMVIVPRKKRHYE